MLLTTGKTQQRRGDSDAKWERRSRPDNTRGMRISANFKTYLRKVSPRRQNQRNQGGKGLEGAQIRIGAVSKGKWLR